MFFFFGNVLEKISPTLFVKMPKLEKKWLFEVSFWVDFMQMILHLHLYVYFDWLD